jgi:HEAT repeat protein
MRDVYAQGTNLRLQRSVVHALRFSGSASIPYLIELLHQEHDADMCMDLALALAWQGRDAVPDLTPLLEAESRTVREYAGMALLATAAPQALHAVSGVRSSRDDGRLKALVTEWLIALQGTPSTWHELSSPGEAGRLCAEQRILQALPRAEDESVITILVSMLAHVPGRDAVPAITEMIRGSDREEFIFQACQILGGRQAEAELELMLGQGNTLIRTFACLALLQAGFPVIQVLADC